MLEVSLDPGQSEQLVEVASSVGHNRKIGLAILDKPKQRHGRIGQGDIALIPVLRRFEIGVPRIEIDVRPGKRQDITIARHRYRSGVQEESEPWRRGTWHLLTVTNQVGVRVLMVFAR